MTEEITGRFLQSPAFKLSLFKSLVYILMLLLYPSIASRAFSSSFSLSSNTFMALNR